METIIHTTPISDFIEQIKAAIKIEFESAKPAPQEILLSPKEVQGLFKPRACRKSISLETCISDDFQLAM